jgi:hypothetical protein
MSPNHSNLYDGDFIDAYTNKEKETLKEHEQEMDISDHPYYHEPYNYQKPQTPYPYSSYINPFEYMDRKDDQEHESENQHYNDQNGDFST